MPFWGPHTARGREQVKRILADREKKDVAKLAAEIPKTENRDEGKDADVGMKLEKSTGNSREGMDFDADGEKIVKAEMKIETKTKDRTSNWEEKDEKAKPESKSQKSEEIGEDMDLNGYGHGEKDVNPSTPFWGPGTERGKEQVKKILKERERERMARRNADYEIFKQTKKDEAATGANNTKLVPRATEQEDGKEVTIQEEDAE